jgi:hypothetical protein
VGLSGTYSPIRRVASQVALSTYSPIRGDCGLQPSQKTRKGKIPTSCYYGVNACGRRWHARVSACQKERRSYKDLGYFDTEEQQAAIAIQRSTAPFEHRRPVGLEAMSDSYRAEMRRRLHIRILFSRKGCFAKTGPAGDRPVVLGGARGKGVT